MELNYTESFLFCTSRLLDINDENLSFWTKELSENKNYLYAQALETLKTPQKIDRQLMKDNQSCICFRANWSFFLRHFTHLFQETPTEQAQLIWNALNYDYHHFPDELWNFNFQKNFRLLGLNFNLPNFVVYQEKEITEIVFSERKVAREVQKYLENRDSFLGGVPSQLQGTKISIVTELAGIKTFFYPEMINDFWIERKYRIITNNLLRIILGILLINRLINLEWIYPLIYFLILFLIGYIWKLYLEDYFSKVILLVQGVLCASFLFYIAKTMNMF